MSGCVAPRATQPVRGTGGPAHPRTDVELEFELDEHGRVWMIREGDCHIIGRRAAVRLEMWRFLAGTELRGGEGRLLATE